MGSSSSGGCHDPHCSLEVLDQLGDRSVARAQLVGPHLVHHRPAPRSGGALKVASRARPGRPVDIHGLQHDFALLVLDVAPGLGQVRLRAGRGRSGPQYLAIP